jgi:predicted N-acetyltransferase YhbS
VQATVRPMREDDLEAARQVQEASFSALDRELGEPVQELTPAGLERQRRRLRHFLTHDPDGSWVATRGDEVVGVALALRRDRMWGLSLLVVHPDEQSQGIGRRLLDPVLRYAEGVDTAVILSSPDPRAVRRYATAGFALFPQVGATGPLDRGLLPAPDPRLRTGDVADADFANAVDRDVRGATRGPDHEALNGFATMYVAEHGSARGYAYVAGGRVATVAATNPELATALLWQGLADEASAESERHDIAHITGEQQWAVDVAFAARLTVKPSGPVFWRNRTPPPCYLPNGAYL